MCARPTGISIFRTEAKRRNGTQQILYGREWKTSMMLYCLHFFFGVARREKWARNFMDSRGVIVSLAR
jgi:hypothetical protein